MRRSKLKASAFIVAMTGCMMFNKINAKAESVFANTAVAGFSLSMEELVNAEEDQVPDVLAEGDTEVDPLAAGATEVKQVTDIPDAEETKAEKATEAKAEEEKKSSEYDDVAVAKVTKYLNVRKRPTEDSEVVGKLYKGAAGTILKTKKSGWTKIKSGSVTGWVKSDFIVTGDDVEAYADKVCDKTATVTAQTLKVREKATTDAKVVTLIPEGEEYHVLKEKKGWVAIKVDEDVKGYVSKEFVDIDFDFDDAVSIEEERKAEEEAARALEEQAQRQQEEANASASTSSNSDNTSSSSSSTSSSTSQSSSSNSSDKSYNSAGSTTRQNIVNFAVQFVGNPYVYGGTSLTNGADCSGFTQSVYRNFGISISRTSREQATNGSSVSLSNVQPGDLIFYKNGSTIGHVALYIGNGQVVHASSPQSGIKISNMYYRTPYCARSILG